MNAVLRDVALASHNSFAIACTARELFALQRPDQLRTAWQWLNENPETLILGGGSNLLLARDRIDTVLRVQLRGRRVVEQQDRADTNDVLVEAAAGENWHELVQWTLSQNIYGLENLALIPGLCGAAPVQNIGAYGVELDQRFDCLQAMNVQDGTLHEFDGAACQFGYRDSLFKAAHGQWLITRIRMRLSRRPELQLDYAALRDELHTTGIGSPTAQQVAKAVCAVRRRKLPDPATLGNAGSFFKNPIVSQETAQRLRESLPGLPVFTGKPAGTGSGAPATVKLSAGWLIEQAGFKGHRLDDAGVHAEHALVLVNYGQASGGQILALAETIMQGVREKFGVVLEPEPVVVRS